MSLVDRAKSGDDAAFSTLIEPLIEPARHLALGMLHHPDAAEDAVQEACLRAWRKLHTFRDGGERSPAWSVPAARTGIVLSTASSHSVSSDSLMAGSRCCNRTSFAAAQELGRAAMDDRRRESVHVALETAALHGRERRSTRVLTMTLRGLSNAMSPAKIAQKRRRSIASDVQRTPVSADCARRASGG